MSDKLSTILLNEMNEAICFTDDSEEVDIKIIGEIEVFFEWIPGLREKSSLLWAFEEEHLYNANSYSKKKKATACTCMEPKCYAWVFVRDDGTAYRLSSISHSSHGSFYEKYKHMYCFNKMKERAISAPASTTPFEIYSDVLLE